jgi:hypothetical protein
MMIAHHRALHIISTSHLYVSHGLFVNGLPSEVVGFSSSPIKSKPQLSFLLKLSNISGNGQNSFHCSRLKQRNEVIPRSLERTINLRL